MERGERKERGASGQVAGNASSLTHPLGEGSGCFSLDGGGQQLGQCSAKQEEVRGEGGRGKRGARKRRGVGVAAPPSRDEMRTCEGRGGRPRRLTEAARGTAAGP